MENMYCECGHLALGDTCSHCVRRKQLATMVTRPKTALAAGPNATLTELRALKSMLDAARITEAEYDERRNYILATF